MINLAFIQRSVDIVRNGRFGSKWVYMSSDSLRNGTHSLEDHLPSFTLDGVKAYRYYVCTQDGQKNEP